MRNVPIAIGASLALALSLLAGGVAMAQSNTPAGTASPMAGHTKPNMGKGPTQKSMPTSAAPATRTHTTGATNQSKTVKKMNTNAKAKVETEGK